MMPVSLIPEGFADTSGHVTCRVIRDLVCSALQITDHYRALTAIQRYIEGRTVPTLGRTLVVNFVNSTALSGITQVVPIATLLVSSGLAHRP
jgi:hypothetical protein